jgi:hypothetical protein
MEKCLSRTGFQPVGFRNALQDLAKGDRLEACPTESSLLQHDFGRFDNRRNAVADFQLHLLGAAPGDDTFNQVLPHSNGGVSHDAIHFKLHNFPLELIPCRKFRGHGDALFSPIVFGNASNLGQASDFSAPVSNRLKSSRNTRINTDCLDPNRTALAEQEWFSIEPQSKPSIFRRRPYQSI